MSDLSSTTGAITGIVGLGLTIGALGLALNFAGEAARGFKDEPRRQRRQANYYDDDIYNYKEPKPKKRKTNYDDDIFNWENYV